MTGVFMKRRLEPVDSKDGHKRTSSRYLTFVNPTTCATGYFYLGKKVF